MRPFRSVVLLAVLTQFVAFSLVRAQAPAETVDREAIAKIKEEGLKHSKVMETISYLTDVHGPRLTGSPLTRAAGEWTKAKLTEWGLENTHLESWGPFGKGWTLESFTANMVQPNFSPLIAYPKAWSPSTQKVIRGEPVFFDAANEQDLEKYRGKLSKAIVLLSPPREVKALFEAPARRQTDEALLALANSAGSGSRSSTASGSAAPSTPPATAAAKGLAAPNGQRPGMTSEQRTAMQLQSKKLQMIYDEKAAVVLEPGRGDGGTVFVGAVSMPNPTATPGENPANRARSKPWSKTPEELVPQVVMAVEHYNRIVRMVQKGVPIQLEIDIASRFHADDLNSFNIFAEIPGTDLKDEIVMLGAHFDSWHSGTGATDNAVGCGVALEAVRILKAVGVKPRRTIRIGLWTGEEQGLLGSRAYVEQHFGRQVTPQRTESAGGPPKTKDVGEAPKFELKPEHANLSAYFNLDNGTGKVRGVYLQGNELLRPVFRAWLAPFSDMGATTISASNTYGTDHLSFDGVGLPGFQFIQDPLEYESRTHHSSMDVYERIQEDDVKQASVIMASFVYFAAMRNEKLPRKPLIGKIATPSPAETKSGATTGTFYRD